MKAFYAFVMLAAILFLAGCGGQGGSGGNAQGQEATRPLRQLSVTLDGKEGAENVGILMAQMRGYFADEHLSVWILNPTLPARPIQYVAGRQDDLGVTQEPQLALAKAEGDPIIAVGSLVKKPTAALIWLKKSRINGIGDLKGKTIALPGVPFQKEFLEQSLARYGLTLDDVKLKYVGYEAVHALVSGHADAIFGSWSQEGVELESQGLKPVITRLRTLGIPAYEESVVIARSDRVARDPGLIRDFMAATAHGTAAAVEDPKAAVKAIEAGLGDPELSRKTLEAEVVATSPMLSKSGYMYPEEARRLVDWMHGQGIFNSRPPPPSTLLTNRFAAWQP